MIQPEVEPPKPHVIYSGVQNPPPRDWKPFEWSEPKLGKQIHGEVTITRNFGTKGELSSGFWRTGPTSPGAQADGSHKITYSSPLGDETACIIDGTAVLTIVSTGEQHKVGPGSIISSPKGLEVLWEIEAPSFKKFWVIWNGSDVAPNPPTDLQINHVSDNPDAWTEYHFTEPKEGPQIAGELYFIRTSGSTGTLLSGIWRSGKGIAATNLDDKGTLTTPFTGILGDETMLLLEGEVEIIETESGKKHNFRAGDVIGLTSGMHITWVSKGPFVKKLWIITRDELPQA